MYRHYAKLSQLEREMNSRFLQESGQRDAARSQMQETIIIIICTIVIIIIIIIVIIIICIVIIVIIRMSKFIPSKGIVQADSYQSSFNAR